jgi:hypothetical protein
MVASYNPSFNAICSGEYALASNCKTLICRSDNAGAFLFGLGG